MNPKELKDAIHLLAGWNDTMTKLAIFRECSTSAKSWIRFMVNQNKEAIGEMRKMLQFDTPRVLRHRLIITEGP